MHVLIALRKRLCSSTARLLAVRVLPLVLIAGGVAWMAVPTSARSACTLICPNGSGGSGYDVMGIDATVLEPNGTPLNGTVGSPNRNFATPIPAGDTIIIKSTFTDGGPCSACTGPLFSWIDAGSDGEGMDDAIITPWTGNVVDASGFDSIGHPTAIVDQPSTNTSSEYNASPNDPTAAAPGTATYGSPSNNCPSFYYDGFSHYYDGAEAHPGQPFPTNPEPPVPANGVHTCGTQGKSVIWAFPGSSVSPGNQYQFAMAVHIPETARDTKPFCFRGFLAVNDITDEFARSTEDECFRIDDQVTIGGWVTSDSQDATGKGLGGVPMNLTDCGSTIYGQTTTIASGPFTGYYQFNSMTGTVTRGEPFCVGPAQTDITFQGTEYNTLEDPTNYDDYCSADTCNEYDFAYEPAPNPPPIVKTSIQQQDGQTLLPGDNPTCQANRDAAGCRVDYTVSTTNVYDANFQSTGIEDKIPLNLNPDVGDVVIDSVQLSSNGGTGPNEVPSGWSVNTINIDPSTCIDGVYHDFTYGYQGQFDNQGNEQDGSFDCFYTAGTGDTPPSLQVNFSPMPAYSTLTVHWHGYTKAANNIGVYPGDPSLGDYTYCPPGFAPDYGNDGRLTECEDFTTGIEGVSNFANATVDGAVDNSYSGITYSPFQTQLQCIGKHFNTSNWTGSNSVGACGVTNGVGGSVQYYGSNSGYNTATAVIEAASQPGYAPIFNYTMYDQAGAQPFDPDMKYDPGAGVCSPAGNGDTCGGSANGPLTWQSNPEIGPLAIGDNAPSNFSFGAALGGANEPIGHQLCNTSEITWPDYTQPANQRAGHTQPEVSSGAACMTRANITAPFFTTSGGDVGGGNGLAGQSKSCQINPNPTESANVGGVIDNPGGVGTYVVSASGTIDYSPGSDNGKTDLNNGGQVLCHPDVLSAVTNYVQHNAPSNSFPANGSTSGVVEENVAPGTFTWPSNVTTVSGDWTLYVKGNLYITSNIVADNSLATLDNLPALGIVVDGNVYIAPNVTRIDAYIYANSSNAAATAGIINTCATVSGSTVSTLGTGSGPNILPTTACDNPLTVNGFAMGRSIRFNRTVQPPASSETFNFNPLLFANPPPGFAGDGSTGQADDFREVQPRY